MPRITIIALGVVLFATGPGRALIEAKDYRFIRGDCNGDSVIGIADAIEWLSTFGACPAVCSDAADINDDGLVDIGDPIFLLDFLFAGGPAVAAPFPALGCDGTPVDGLPCTSPSSGSTVATACP